MSEKLEDEIDGMVEKEADEAYEKAKEFREMLYDLLLTEEEISGLITLDLYREEIIRGENPNRFFSDVNGARRRFEKSIGTVLEGIWKRELKMYENIGFRNHVFSIYKELILPMLEKKK